MPDGALQLRQPEPGEQLTPAYILRGHDAQVSALTFSSNNRSLCSGDVKGLCARWSLNSFRPDTFWRAHSEGLLTVAEWSGGLLTHGRDNKIKFWRLPAVLSSLTRASAHAVPSPTRLTELEPEWEMDVNSMAYCHMSLLEIGSSNALVAVPALTKDDFVDIFHLPSQHRLHRSIGDGAFVGSDKTGSVMSVVLHRSKADDALALLVGYEDGRSVLFRFTGNDEQALVPSNEYKSEGQGWEIVWQAKGHRDAIMGQVISPDRQHAWSIGADHFLSKYTVANTLQPDEQQVVQYATLSPGRSSMAIRDDGALIAVAGWDGCGRLYSALSGAPLAVLEYHRMSLHAAAFAPTRTKPDHDQDERPDSSDEDDEPDHAAEPPRGWLALAGTDTRISLWTPYAPQTSS